MRRPSSKPKKIQKNRQKKKQKNLKNKLPADAGLVCQFWQEREKRNDRRWTEKRNR